MTPIALAPQTSAAACPSCGRPVRRPRHGPAPTTFREPVDPSRMSYADLCRHYHRTAPVEDLRFFLRHARLSTQLRADGDALLAAGCRDTGGVVSRREWYRRLTGLQGRWRRETAEVSCGPTTHVDRGTA
jgi:hypothetical protein